MGCGLETADRDASGKVAIVAVLGHPALINLYEIISCKALLTATDGGYDWQ